MRKNTSQSANKPVDSDSNFTKLYHLEAAESGLRLFLNCYFGVLIAVFAFCSAGLFSAKDIGQVNLLKQATLLSFLSLLLFLLSTIFDFLTNSNRATKKSLWTKASPELILLVLSLLSLVGASGIIINKVLAI